MDRASKHRIELVEAAYNLEVGPREWLPNLLRAGGTALDLGHGCAATIWAGTSSEGEPLVSQLHAENGSTDLPMRFVHAAREIGPRFARATPAPRGPGVHTLAEEKAHHPEVHEALTRHVGCRDILTLWAMDPDSSRCWNPHSIRDSDRTEPSRSRALADALGPHRCGPSPEAKTGSNAKRTADDPAPTGRRGAARLETTLSR